MSDMTHKFEQEYWRPPRQVSSVAGDHPLQLCPRCQAELAAGSNFCHICGAARRGTSPEKPGISWPAAGYAFLHEKLGLGGASLFAFFLGLIFALIAFGVGLLYSANTMPDWQAIQLWRVQWLLASMVSFVAGILLKK